MPETDAEQSCCRCRPVASKVMMMIFLFLGFHLVLLAIIFGAVGNDLVDLRHRCNELAADYEAQSACWTHNLGTGLIVSAIVTSSVGGPLLLIALSIYWGRSTCLPAKISQPIITEDACGSRCNLTELGRVAWFFAFAAYTLVVTGAVITAIVATGTTSHDMVVNMWEPVTTSVAESIALQIKYFQKLGVVGYGILMPIGFSFLFISFILFATRHEKHAAVESQQTIVDYEMVRVSEPIQESIVSLGKF